MPRGREWVPTIELGVDVRFLLTPEEAARTEKSLERQGIQAGPGLQPLRRIMAPTPSLPTAPAAGTPDVGSLLDAGVLLAAAGDKELRRSIAHAAQEHGVDPSTDAPMVELALNGARVFRAFATSTLTVIMDGAVRRISVDDARRVLADGDGPVLAVLSESSLDEDLQSAAFRVWENRSGNEHLTRLAESWKEAVQARIRAEEWSAKRIASEFTRRGATITAGQARSIFLDGDTWAAYYKEEALVSAALQLGGQNPSEGDVDAHVAAIRRIRGVHRAAGRWANNLGKATYLEADDDLVKQARDEHHIDIAELRRHFFVARVEGVRGPVMLPAAFLGLHADNQDVIP